MSGVGTFETDAGYYFSDGELDGDGFPDIYVYGVPPTVVNKDAGWGLYRSDGNMGLLTVDTGNRHLGWRSWDGASSIWADFNGDGWDDLLVAEGNVQYDIPAFHGIFLNDGQGHLTNSGWSLPVPPLGLVSVTAGDIFNHGRNDIVMAGIIWGSAEANGGFFTFQATVLRNEGGGVFTPLDYGFALASCREGDGCQLADYDKDGRLDLSTVHGVGSVEESLNVYRNELDIPSNAPPQAPVNLSTVVGPGTVTFHWGSATDDITPTNLLTHNLRVGTNSLGTSVVSPLANVTNGWRKISGPGNCRHIFSTTYYFPPGTYYWSVQAIDGAFAGGAWATEKTFTITEPERPKIEIGDSNNSQTTLRWPARFPDHVLQQATSLTSTNWTTVTNAPFYDDGKIKVTTASQPTARFFRLSKP